MKTSRLIKNNNLLHKVAFIFVGLLVFNTMFAQGPPPEEGMSVPIDGGILMALLAGGGLITMLFKKKKKDE